MASYIELNYTQPLDLVSLLDSLRTSISPTIGISERPNGIIIAKKNTDWLAPEIALAQSIVSSAEPRTNITDGKNDVDKYPIHIRAFALVVLDEVNLIRSNLGLPQRTVNQLMTAIKNKVQEIG